jgi:hypothetical protein
LHTGLLPAGFSAEHLGPNDFYYWDNFWGIAGLRAAAWLLEQSGDGKEGGRFAQEADDFYRDVELSIAKVGVKLGRPAIPASPLRRLDAGAIGSLAISYPLQICQPDDPRLLNTVNFLLENCLVDDGFFQDMIHSGINAYLTLHIAQVLLRAGDHRYQRLVEAVAALASPTGQWPEAIHPRTGGGCMGDGQHAWAAAEWISMIRNCLVREEGGGLVLASGVLPNWFTENESIKFGPAPTSFGLISLCLEKSSDQGAEKVLASWRGEWHLTAPAIKVQLPGFLEHCVKAGEKLCAVELQPKL